MIKLLIGGSPCTYWSIAQKKNRETEPSGLGWELFENYLIAKEKFKPNFFLYENNKSAAQAIKDEIKKRLNVWDGTLFMPDSGARYIEINSALVSAQNRQRFYVHNCGEVEQPADRGIILRDILETGQDLLQSEKSYCLTASYNGDCAWNTLERKQRTMVAEPVAVNVIKDEARTLRATYYKDGIRNLVGNNIDRKTCVAVPVCVQEQVHGRKANKDGTYDRRYGARIDGKSGSLTATNRQNAIAEPIRIGDIGSTAQAHRVYSCDGKSVTINAGGGGQGGKTGLYACPIFENVGDFVSSDKPIYVVNDGKINIRGKEYPIKLQDGFYIIRKLTVTECCRLQTLPDDYCRAVSKTQAYKGLGNGWTAEVIIHILNGALKDIPRDEKIVVLSMYDGIGTGRYCLDKMGFKNVEYHAFEIDKYAMQIAKSNFPDIIEHGDAFQVREDNFTI